jgi:hypothetical protein
MVAFVHAAFGVPAALFSSLLIVVIAYWLLVVIGAGDIDLLDSNSDGVHDGEDPGRLPGIVAAIGLHGVPVTVVLSLLITVAWFVSLAGTVAIGRLHLPLVGGVALAIGVVLTALVFALLVTRLLVLPLRSIFAAEPAASRHDFVGRSCVIRTGRVDGAFGQAEVTAPDGSAATIQVRQDRADPLTSGSVALIYDYEVAGEFFWVMPYDTSPNAGHPGGPVPFSA